jgi:galactose oxidase-like protein
MIETERWEILPACLRAGGAARAFTVFISWAAVLGGCVREHPEDHWLPGVDCDAASGICLAERPDRRASTFALAPDCWQLPESLGEPGINAQRMTLTDDGRAIVLAGSHMTQADASRSTAGVAIAHFEDDGGNDGDCPPIEWPEWLDDDAATAVANGAHVVGPDGSFWSFVGNIGGTWGAMSHDAQSGWVPHPVPSPAPPLSPDLNWNAPNALAIALPAHGVAIVRSAATDDAKARDLLPPNQVEWWTFGLDPAPARSGHAVIESGILGYAAMHSTRGQLRLFSVGDHLAVLGDSGRAEALSAGASTLGRLGDRPADRGFALPNYGSASVFLPFRSGSTYAPGSVLYIGGSPDKDLDPAHRRRLDLYDPASDTWTRAVGGLPRGRNFTAPVLLPDGSILLAGDSGGARDVFYIDPQRDFAVTVGHDILSRTRGVGVGGLVVASGRVVLAGGNQPDGEEMRAPPDVDVWEPPYLDVGARAAQPTIAKAPGSIAIDRHFSIDMTPDSAPVTGVVLLAFGSSFMGNNPNQRLIELAMQRDANDPRSPTIALTGPPAGWAPAGRYLLFALGADRIPSVGIAVDVVEGDASP